MRSLVIFDSLFGNTEVVARSISEGLSDRGSSQVLAVTEVKRSDIEKAQLVVVGGPTQLRGFSPSMKAVLRRSFDRAWDRRPVAVFDTRFREDAVRTGSAAARLTALLERRGALVLTAPESFFVTAYKGPLQPGEADRALLWGRSLHLGDRVPALPAA